MYLFRQLITLRMVAAPEHSATDERRRFSITQDDMLAIGGLRGSLHPWRGRTSLHRRRIRINKLSVETFHRS